MNPLKCIVPLILTLAVLPASTTSAGKIDDLLAGRTEPLWSPVAYYGPEGGPPSCYLGNCDFESANMQCIGETCTDKDYSRCTAQNGACSRGCAGTTPGVPESTGNCYPAY